MPFNATRTSPAWKPAASAGLSGTTAVIWAAVPVAWRRNGKRRALWGAFLGVVALLLVLLALQYRWLSDLEHTSKVARHAAYEHDLARIAREVRFVYSNAAERSLNLPAALLEPRYHHKLGKYFEKRSSDGIQRLFVVHFAADPPHQLLLFDPGSGAVSAPEEFTPEVRAIYMAAAPWSVLSKKGGAVDEAAFVVEERDPDHRMILKPITDEGSQVVGLAGMIVDRGYFLGEVLPRAVASSLPVAAEEELVVTVRDATGEVVFGEEPAVAGADGEGWVSERPFSFLFTDHRIALGGRHSTPEQWARANFALNLTLSLVLGLALLGGLALVVRTAAREIRLSEMKNDFVSNVSHELRTPLASIRVFGELLRLGRAGTSAKVREYGEYIETESRRLTQLIDNILDFSRIESGRKVYELEVADLGEIVADALAAFEVRLRHRGFRLDFRGPATPLPPVRADRGAIRQALANLLDNAVKYSGDHREIRVELGRDKERAVVAVSDRGIGISRREQERIFDRFHRVGTSLVHDVKGCGLGLSIVRHIVQAHGGEVAVKSASGAGSTFFLRLPFLGERAAATGETPPAVQPSGGGAV
jgi:signal transduction histidine kinase